MERQYGLKGLPSNAKIYNVQKRMVIGIVRGYRTISFEATTILARFPVLDILVEMDANVYVRIRNILQNSENESEEALEFIREQERQKGLMRYFAFAEEGIRTPQRIH